MAQIGCKIVSMTAKPVETILCAWFNSRDMRLPGTTWVTETFWERLQHEFEEWQFGNGEFFILKALLGEKWKLELDETPAGVRGRPRDEIAFNDVRIAAQGLFFDVMKIDAPIQEFIVFNLSFDNAPRSFVDQLDRQRQAGFWEQSVRVMDLTTFAEKDHFFRPPGMDAEVEAEYVAAMKNAEASYTKLTQLGMRPEHARGIIPMHVNVRADVVINMRSLMAMCKKRLCYFAQGDYWQPALNAFFSELQNSPNCTLPRDPRILGMFGKLPCDGQTSCPYHRDIMDRMTDKSNPICPILFTFLTKEEKELVVKFTQEKYGMDWWKDNSAQYLKSMGREKTLKVFNDEVAGV